MKTGLTAAQLKEFLEYDPITGLFVWIKTAPNKTQFLGKIAGNRAETGYITIKLLGTIYLAHRLAWLYMTGEWPDHHIDHRNRRRDDNEWLNLRRGGYCANAQNRPAKEGTQFGLKGVFLVNDRFRRKPFAAKIGANGKTHYLGYFETPEDAHEAYCEASKKFHGEYARTA